MSFQLKTDYKKIIADTITPVSVYLKIRDRFPNSLLLESSDYHGSDNSFSYICCNPISDFTVKNETIIQNLPNGKTVTQKITSEDDIPDAVEAYGKLFKTDSSDFKFINNGLFGYIAYIFAHTFNKESNIEEIASLINVKNFASYSFDIVGETTSNIDDETFKKNVTIAKQHCQRGDVFQLVLSKRFSQKFKGDEFNVYRALRSVNPSPYLFYFDYGDFKIFGSSPVEMETK